MLVLGEVHEGVGGPNRVLGVRQPVRVNREVRRHGRRHANPPRDGRHGDREAPVRHLVEPRWVGRDELCEAFRGARKAGRVRVIDEENHCIVPTQRRLPERQRHRAFAGQPDPARSRRELRRAARVRARRERGHATGGRGLERLQLLLLRLDEGGPLLRALVRLEVRRPVLRHPGLVGDDRLRPRLLLLVRAGRGLACLNGGREHRDARDRADGGDRDEQTTPCDPSHRAAS